MSASRPHMAVVTYTRRLRHGFRKRYEVRCWECPLRLGPYVSRADANAARQAAER